MKIGTGWCGWTEVETDNTSMPVIVDAYSAKLEMIRLMTGRGPSASQLSGVPPPPGTKMTTELMLAMLGKTTS
jgi:hypothetical protein